MGVPALFRWLSAKYPKIISSALEIPAVDADGISVAVNLEDPNPNGTEFDNLYLDMNGIIHPCCHPENRLAPETEEDMMAEIFKYMDRLFAMVRPRRVLFLAIDGVAPRAKMNQQRSRRFRAAQEAREKAEREMAIREELQSMGKEVKPKDMGSVPFDSNSITPGTPFMAKVARSVRYYVVDKTNREPAWKDVKIVFSDASVPGEGEHKIMDYIRRQRLDPMHDPNTQHVIYGLDADLIMLALATHEPRFWVLREDVFAEEKKKANTCYNCGLAGHMAESCPGKPEPSMEEEAKKLERGPEHKPFILLDVSMLREYLEIELEHKDLSFEFELERAIDDWIFLCFFVGNDFLPHLPSLEIREGAIDTLIDIYKRKLGEMGGYLCHHGNVDLKRVEMMMHELGTIEDEVFKRRREKEERRMEGTKRRKLVAAMQRRDSHLDENPAASYKPTHLQIQTVSEARSLAANQSIVEERRIARSRNLAAAQALKTSESAPPTPLPIVTVASQTLAGQKRSASSDDDEPTDDVRLWEAGAKDRYYETKFKTDARDYAFISKVVGAYVEGLCWVMAYYFRGCPSWKWFYPYHYAPFASDFHDIRNLDVKFELGQPFRPFDQLMSVFPAASREHIPEPFHRLMTEAESEIIEFYPESFPIDLNGKKFAWQGVALLPFIEEERLLAALESIYPELDQDVLRMNIKGRDELFVNEANILFKTIEGLGKSSDELVQLDGLLSHGFTGDIQANLESPCHPAGTFPSPLAEIGFGDLTNLHCICCWYYVPFYSQSDLVFPSKILPGAKLPEKRLDAEDVYQIKSGGANRRNRPLIPPGKRYGNHSMHRDYQQRTSQRPAERMIQTSLGGQHYPDRYEGQQREEHGHRHPTKRIREGDHSQSRSLPDQGQGQHEYQAAYSEHRYPIEHYRQRPHAGYGRHDEDRPSTRANEQGPYHPGQSSLRHTNHQSEHASLRESSRIEQRARNPAFANFHAPATRTFPAGRASQLYVHPQDPQQPPPSSNQQGPFRAVQRPSEAGRHDEPRRR